jgi:hypothetical protein
MRAAPRLALLLVGLVPACTEPNPSYDPDAAAALCERGQRRCGAAGQTQVCVPQSDDLLVWTDDYCPSGAVCAGGVCAPPAGAAACARDADCGADVCVVFVQGSTLGRFCAPATGTAAGSAPCATHADCRSGLCQLGTGGKTCFSACTETTDCTGAPTCQDAEVTVSGIRGTIRGCLTP